MLKKNISTQRCFWDIHILNGFNILKMSINIEDKYSLTVSHKVKEISRYGNRFFFDLFVDSDPINDPTDDPESDSDDPETKSFTISNLSKDFIKGVYSVLWDIINDQYEYDEIELKSNCEFKNNDFPFNNVVAHFGDGFRYEHDPRRTDDPQVTSDFWSLDIITYANKHWKNYILCDNYNEVDQVNMRYITELSNNKSESD